jgi:hypothetical protein
MNPISVENVITYCRSSRRVCPEPNRWHELYQLLLRNSVGGRQPYPPFILGAWWHTTDEQKQDRLADHIRLPQEFGVLDQVDAFLRSLFEREWHHLGRNPVGTSDDGTIKRDHRSFSNRRRGVMKHISSLLVTSRVERRINCNCERLKAIEFAIANYNAMICRLKKQMNEETANSRAIRAAIALYQELRADLELQLGLERIT